MKGSVRYRFIVKSLTSVIQIRTFKSMRWINVLLITLFCSSLSQVKGQIIDPDMSMTESGYTPGFVREMKPKVDNPYSKSYYLAGQWQTGSILLKSGEEIKNVPIKYDVVKNLIEVKFDKDVYYISSRNVDSFKWFDYSSYRENEFVPCHYFEIESENPVGFFKKVYDGKLQLYIHYTVSVFQANSSVSVTGSHRDNDIVWNEEYYVNFDDKLVKLHPKRKPNLYLFEENQDQVLHYMRISGYWFKNEGDIIQVLQYFDTLN